MIARPATVQVDSSGEKRPATCITAGPTHPLFYILAEMHDIDAHAPARDAAFPETRWSVILRTRERDGDAYAALEQFCRGYWFPLYAFARRAGRDPHDAVDLTQAFFAHLLERGTLV